MTTITLEELLKEYGADAVVFEDRGNGAGFYPGGEGVPADPLPLPAAEIEMRRLPTQHVSADGVRCHWASDWHDDGDYEWRVFF